MRKLLNGIVDFRRCCLENYRRDFAHLVAGQSPDALFIACSDSRVVPNLFASTNPGDLFVIRNVGNLIPTFRSCSEHPGTAEAAALAFSMQNLPITNIIVCGHSECGAMQAVLGGVDRIENLDLQSWLHHCTCRVDQLVNLSSDPHLAPHNQLAQMNVLQQLEHLKTYPVIQNAVRQGRLSLHGWYFDIATGDVLAFEEEQNQFIVIDEVEAARILTRLP